MNRSLGKNELDRLLTRHIANPSSTELAPTIRLRPPSIRTAERESGTCVIRYDQFGVLIVGMERLGTGRAWTYLRGERRPR